MGRPLRRIWLRRRKQTRWGGRAEKGKYLLVMAPLAGILAALILLWRLDVALRPAVSALAGAQVERLVTAQVEEALSALLAEDALACEGLYTVQTGADGSITAVTANSGKLNRLRSELLARIITQVESLDSNELSIPLGSLTGWALLSNRGPAVTAEILSAAVPSARFESQFTAAGINQTLHRVVLSLEVEVTLLLPGGTEEKRVDSQLVVSETLLVGEVPETYLGWTAGEA